MGGSGGREKGEGGGGGGLTARGGIVVVRKLRHLHMHHTTTVVPQGPHEVRGIKMWVQVKGRTRAGRWMGDLFLNSLCNFKP